MRMKARNIPKKLWDYILVWEADLRCLMPHPIAILEGRTPYEKLKGSTPDITEYLLFEPGEYVWYYENENILEGLEKLGRVIGIANSVGQALCYWVVKGNGEPIARLTIRPVLDRERNVLETQERIKKYDASLEKALGGPYEDGTPVPGLLSGLDMDEFWAEHNIGDDYEPTYDPMDPEKSMPEADDYETEAYDNLISAKVIIPSDGIKLPGTVKRQKIDEDGKPIGRSHNNPILDTRVYEIEFEDGRVREYAANLVAENIYAQVDSEGREYQLLEDICDHKSDGSAVQKADGMIQGKNGNLHKKKTTKGWQLLVNWKDGSSSWEPLKDLKESNPIEVAQYAVMNQISDEPAFAWWVEEVLKIKDRILAKVKTRYWKKIHKFGLELPKTVERALEIDRETETTFWRDAIEKEMKNAVIAFDVKDKDESAPIGIKQIKVHMVLDVKPDFTRKARLVANGNMTEVPKETVYFSVVARDAVRIAFLVAALNDMDVLSVDIQNAYLNAPTREKVWFRAGKEFGSKEGQVVVIVRALYGLRSSGSAWHAHLAQVLTDMKFTPSRGDPDLWPRMANKPTGEKYWEYLLTYVDDIIVISHEVKAVMATIAQVYTIKAGSEKEPDQYLGATVRKWKLGEGQFCWGMSSSNYVKEAVRVVKLKLKAQEARLPARCQTPISFGYRPELDVTAYLDDEQTNYYQSLIGILRWAVELGRIDIAYEVSLLSSHLSSPRTGHMQQVYHVFGYLDQYDRSNLVFDPTDIEPNENKLMKVDWQQYYPEAKDELPPDMTEPLGKALSIHCFVDASHASEMLTRRSHTGVLIFLNKAPIIWHTKKQNTVETSTFSSDMVALCIAKEMVQALQCKLWMFGIPLKGIANVYCDNESVVNSTTRPESVLKKRHNAICYHAVREAVAADIIRIFHEPGETQLADILTKSLPGPRRKKLLSCILD